MSPYRTPELPAPPAKRSREIFYASRDQERHVAPGRFLFQALLASGAIGAVVSALGYQTLALAGIAASAAYAIWRWRRAPDMVGVVVRVEHGELSVAAPDGSRVLLAIPLASLCNVRLDTKSIHRVARDTRLGSVVETRLGPLVDVARIELVPLPPNAPVQLTEDYTPHMEAMEWMGKIRMFLRGHGWLPADERESASHG